MSQDVLSCSHVVRVVDRRQRDELEEAYQNKLCAIGRIIQIEVGVHRAIAR